MGPDKYWTVSQHVGNRSRGSVAIGHEHASGRPGIAVVTPDGATTVLRRIPVIEESLDIRKRVVDRGGYRLTKQVRSVEEIVDEALRSHTVHIERRAVGTLLAGLEAPLSRQEGDTLVVPVVKEVLVTEKRLMLVEEIRISRVDAEYRDPQRVTLRTENILIERLEPDSSE